MAANKSRDSSEWFQIAIFTCLFVGGGLALITLVLSLFMNPSSAEHSKRLDDEYKKLTDLLDSTDMRSLRAQAKLAEGQESKLTLKEIISEGLKSYGLDFSQFRDTKPVVRAGVEEVRQPIELKPSKLANILQFIATVKEAKKSIQVETVRIDRDRRAKDKANEDSWTATIEFVDYVGK